MEEPKILLEITNLCVSIANKPVLKNLNLTIREGENHVILGPNGSGKSTLIKTIMGFNECVVTSGSIKFLDKEITTLSVDERSKMGLGLLFQSPPEIQGLSLENLAKACFPNSVQNDEYKYVAQKTSMLDFLDREVNVGFSGGEKKRSEVFQLLLQRPLLALLDEPESGVDYGNVSILGKELARLQNELHGIHRSASLTITHTGQILSWIHAEIGHILCDGSIIYTGVPSTFLRHIQSAGFDDFINGTFVVEENQPEDVLEELVNSKESEEGSSDSEGHRCCGRHGGHHRGGCGCRNRLGQGRNKRCCRSRQVVQEETKPSSTITLNTIDNKVQLSLDEDLYSSVPGEYITSTTDSNKVTLNNDDEYGGYYSQMDQNINQTVSYQEGIEVLNLADALKKYPWILLGEKYMWKALDKDKDEATKAVAENDEVDPKGYVIIAHPGVKCIKPVNSQLIMEQNHNQYVHNIMIAFPGSELTIASTCTFKCPNKVIDDRNEEDAEGGTHYGISEFFIEEDAQLCFSMIHTWCHKYYVFPRSAAIVKKNGVFLSNYVCLEPVNHVQMCPTAILKENATAKFTSVLLAKKGCTLDIGSRSFLMEKGAKTESITRTISKGGVVYARADIQGLAPDTKGHIECQGLVIPTEDNSGMIHSIPQISGAFGTELSHEAAIGKIAQEKIEYLMARGVDEETAVSLLIRGFLTLKVKGIPKDIQQQMDEVISQAAAEGF